MKEWSEFINIFKLTEDEAKRYWDWLMEQGINPTTLNYKELVSHFIGY